MKERQATPLPLCFTQKAEHRDVSGLHSAHAESLCSLCKQCLFWRISLIIVLTLVQCTMYTALARWSDQLLSLKTFVSAVQR